MTQILKITFIFLMFISCILPCNAQTAATKYHVIRHIHVGGKGGWDYIAANNGKLYIAHDSLVNVIDEKSGDSIAVIPGTFGAHGIAFAGDKGFITAGKISSVIVFDLVTNRPSNKIKTAAGPDAIIYEEFSKKILVCDGRGGQLNIIDPMTDKVTDTVILGGRPEEPSTDKEGDIYVNLEDKNEVVQISAKTFKITNRWKMGKGKGPSGLAIDRANHRLFIACDNKLMIVLDAVNGKVISELPTGDGTDGAAFDAGKGLAFSPNGDGTLTVIHEETTDKFVVLANIPTKKGARTIALDEKNHHLFLPASSYGPAQAPSPGHEHPRPPVLPGSFEILEIGE